MYPHSKLVQVTDMQNFQEAEKGSRARDEARRAAEEAARRAQVAEGEDPDEYDVAFAARVAANEEVCEPKYVDEVLRVMISAAESAFKSVFDSFEAKKRAHQEPPTPVADAMPLPVDVAPQIFDVAQPTQDVPVAPVADVNPLSAPAPVPVDVAPQIFDGAQPAQDVPMAPVADVNPSPAPAPVPVDVAPQIFDVAQPVQDAPVAPVADVNPLPAPAHVPVDVAPQVLTGAQPAQDVPMAPVADVNPSPAPAPVPVDVAPQILNVVQPAQDVPLLGRRRPLSQAPTAVAKRDRAARNALRHRLFSRMAPIITELMRDRGIAMHPYLPYRQPARLPDQPEDVYQRAISRASITWRDNNEIHICTTAPEAIIDLAFHSLPDHRIYTSVMDRYRSKFK